MKVTVELSGRDVAILKHDLKDIDEWVQRAVRGKVAACSTRLAQTGRALLAADGATMVPARDDDAIDAALAHPKYQNRAARKEE